MSTNNQQLETGKETESMNKCKLSKSYVPCPHLQENLFFAILFLISAPALISLPSSFFPLSENKGPLWLPYNYFKFFRLTFIKCCWSKKLSSYIKLLLDPHIFKSPNCLYPLKMNRNQPIWKENENETMYIHKVETLLIMIKDKQIFYQRLN